MDPRHRRPLPGWSADRKHANACPDDRKSLPDLDSVSRAI
jgi:hypothetical protein